MRPTATLRSGHNRRLGIFSYWTELEEGLRSRTCWDGRRRCWNYTSEAPLRWPQSSLSTVCNEADWSPRPDTELYNFCHMDRGQKYRLLMEFYQPASSPRLRSTQKTGAAFHRLEHSPCKTHCSSSLLPSHKPWWPRNQYGNSWHSLQDCPLCAWCSWHRDTGWRRPYS